MEQFRDFDSKRMEEKHQKELETNKDTEIAEEFRKVRQKHLEKQNEDCRLKRRMISHLQSRRKENLVLKHSYTCERKMHKN